MRGCYISIPFGIKARREEAIDFDALYDGVIAPSVRGLGIECRRVEEFAPSAIWQKVLISVLVRADWDAFIAESLDGVDPKTCIDAPVGGWLQG